MSEENKVTILIEREFTKEEREDLNMPRYDYIEIDGVQYSLQEIEQLVSANPFHFLKRK